MIVVVSLQLAVLAGCSGDDDRTAVSPTSTPRSTATATRTASPEPTSTFTATAPPTATASLTVPPATSTHTSAPTRTATSLPTATPTDTPIDPKILSGGDTTVFDATRNAFGQPARNLPLGDRTDFFVGNAFFNRNWVTAPSSNAGLDGLGPVFNSRSCSGCHFRDGRGRAPIDDADPDQSLLFRLSVPGTDDHGGPLGDPSYGGQLGPVSILGVPPEGKRAIAYTEVPGQYGDGDAYSLRAPTYDIEGPNFGPPDPQLMISPRVAPALIGSGLLDAIADETLLALADPDDLDGDGISGRPNLVWDIRTQSTVIGRFGWKSNQSTLEQQNAGAFAGDIGLTSDLFPDEDCPPRQIECAAAPTGGSPELDQEKIDFVTFYTAMLAVPARRDVGDPETDRGEEIFREIGCASCHVEQIETGTSRFAPLSAQMIRPYSDLLLHDMGPGLADDRPDYEADGAEWRTPPLWGIGLVATVNRHTFFLHDGRARGLAEAILWHGGEGEDAKEAFRMLPREDRAALIRFLESL